MGKQRGSQESLDVNMAEKKDDESKPVDDVYLLEISGDLFDQKMLVDDRLFMSRLAEMGGMKDDMAEFIIEMVRAKDNHHVRRTLKDEPFKADYSKAERNTICVAMKSVISEKRTTIRIIDEVLNNPKYARYRTKSHAYKAKLQDEMFAAC